MKNQSYRVSPKVAAALDTARAIAACYVIVHHVASSNGWSHGLGAIFRFGQEAVLIFFLLSGFVIFANEQHRADKAMTGYIFRRVRRIYPPLVFAIIVASLVAYWNGNLIERFSFKELISTLFCLQDISFLKPGVIADPYLGDDPLWSLSYEMFFYLIFPLVLRIWKKRPQQTENIIGMTACLAYITFALTPNHFSLVVSYYLVWWTGAMIANAYINGLELSKALKPTIIWLCTLSSISLIIVFIEGFRGAGYYPFLTARHFIFSLFIALISISPLRHKIISLLHKTNRYTFKVASISYGLYVLHYPILINWRFSRSAIGFAVSAILLAIGAYFIEIVFPRYLPKAPVNG